MSTQNLAAIGTGLFSANKGAVLLFALAQLRHFRTAIQQIWAGKDNFIWEESLRDDKDRWIYAGIRAVTVGILYCVAF